MSNVSGASSGSSVGCPRGRVYGVPKTCSCGEKIVELISKSNNNPYRRYYRCGYAVSNKLMNDNHTFKWVDEAHLDEIEGLKMRNARLEKKLEAVTIERMEFERLVFEKVKMKIEEALVESSHTRKEMVIGAIVLCMVMVGFSKLLS
ncbi:unnamed protein product [Microthlaspi erraticum]|uniref:GRF-type domain-containing protein n=1 Tax=Microthlaspi erraticum TaxID=1685480 RepID=A0A6D2JRV3_9BRAS|nr:unnamed protein product [Microthlaspi erraticum]CAA7026617.1 unnamed protein product [Microthlaspi erraticum]CAA7038814.1 unnamed protein product [Microthlaspi erraticum]